VGIRPRFNEDEERVEESVTAHSDRMLDELPTPQLDRDVTSNNHVDLTSNVSISFFKPSFSCLLSPVRTFAHTVVDFRVFVSSILLNCHEERLGSLQVAAGMVTPA
jgi:hypothetical protein